MTVSPIHITITLRKFKGYNAQFLRLSVFNFANPQNYC